MVRVKRGNVLRKRHKKVLARAKGFYGGAKLIFKMAKPATGRAKLYATRDRRARKREFRSLWVVRIHAALLPYGVSYSRFINLLSKSGVRLNRKSLAQVALTDPPAFEYIVRQLTGQTVAQ